MLGHHPVTRFLHERGCQVNQRRGGASRHGNHRQGGGTRHAEHDHPSAQYRIEHGRPLADRNLGIMQIERPRESGRMAEAAVQQKIPQHDGRHEMGRFVAVAPEIVAVRPAQALQCNDEGKQQHAEKHRFSETPAWIATADRHSSAARSPTVVTVCEGNPSRRTIWPRRMVKTTVATPPMPSNTHRSGPAPVVQADRLASASVPMNT